MTERGISVLVVKGSHTSFGATFNPLTSLFKNPAQVGVSLVIMILTGWSNMQIQ